MIANVQRGRDRLRQTKSVTEYALAALDAEPCAGLVERPRHHSAGRAGRSEGSSHGRGNPFLSGHGGSGQLTEAGREAR
jgi:hypothetical protein